MQLLCILDDVKNLLTYRRVKYPWQHTADKIFKIPELDDMLGSRLLTGR